MPRELDDVSVRYECEVLVIGSGVSGYCAGDIPCGKAGLSHDPGREGRCPGWELGSRFGVGITGADRYNHYGTESGSSMSSKRTLLGRWRSPSCSPAMPYNISRRNEAIIQEHLKAAGVTTLKRHYARYPLVAPGGQIISIIAEDLAAFRTVLIEVHGVVVEASGDGEIGGAGGRRL